MKQKVFYVIFILATIFLLIFFNRNRKNDIGQSVSTQNNSQQFSAEQQEILTKQPQPVLSPESKPAVTFIKKTKSAEKTVSLENKIINSSIRPKKLPASSGSLAAASGAKNTQAVLEKPESGVTKIGKRPPIQRIEELGEQGVILQ